MSDAVDEHLDKAFASLDDLSMRELEATVEAIGSRRHPLHEFAGGSIFRGVASARERRLGVEPCPFHLGHAVSWADEDFVKRIAEAQAPFWQHVRDALAERQP
jgi:hypothetical protein